MARPTPWIHKDTVEIQLPRLKSKDQLECEGAAQALGWLAKTKEDIDKAVPVLIAALKDGAMEVRRNAAESLGRIGDSRSIDALTTWIGLQREKDDWVREVAEEQIELIRMKRGAAKLPEKGALNALADALKHKWALVRQTSAELLVKGGKQAVQLLIGALKDEDADVRASAAKSLAGIGDTGSVNPLKQALTKEENETAKKAMEEAIKNIEK